MTTVAFGLALLIVATAALLAAGFAWKGIAPQSATPRVWKLAYWYANSTLVVAIAASALAVVLWLARVLGALALRLAP
jgi:hypothetical protein